MHGRTRHYENGKVLVDISVTTAEGPGMAQWHLCCPGCDFPVPGGVNGEEEKREEGKRRENRTGEDRTVCAVHSCNSSTPEAET